MSKILILGGNGFLGKSIHTAFQNDTKNEFVLINVSRRTGTDLTKSGEMYNILLRYNPDIIINAAAHVGSINYVTENAADVVVDNSLMYINMYNEIAKSGKTPLVINIISNCSYPGNANIQKEDEWWNGEIHNSVLSYGTPKKLGYVISKCFEKQYGIKTLNLIVPNAYGPGDYLTEDRVHAMNGIIIRMIKAMRSGDTEFTIWGSGTPIREWVYMPDVGKLIYYIIKNKMFDLPNPINIGQNRGISVIESAEMVKNILNYNVQLKNDLTKQDGAPIKILDDVLFRENFPDFKFTEYNIGITETISYYKKLLK